MSLRQIRQIALLVFLLPLLLACEQSPEATIGQAEQSRADRDYRAAVVELKSLLQRDPENMQARWLLGQVYLDVEDGASAEKELLRARSLGVVDDSVLPALAHALLLQGKSAEVLALQPQGALSRLAVAELDASRALALLASGEPGKADAQLASAQAAAPRSPWVRLSHATLLFSAEKTAEARQVLDSLVEEVPDNGRAWSLLGQVLEREGAVAEAEAAYDKAVTYRYRSAQDAFKRGLARVKLGNVDGAAEDAKLLAKWQPKSYLTHYLTGLVAVQRARYAEAAEALEAGFSANNQHFQTVFLLAVSQQAVGNEQRALEMAERAQAMAPGHIPARKLLARMYLARRQGAEAGSLVRPIVNAVPDDLEAKDLLATSLMIEGKAAEAAQLLEQIATQQQDQAQAQLRAGVALVAAGQAEAGRAAMRRAIELAPDEAQISRTMIASLLDSPLTGDALAEAKRYVASAPDDATAWSLLGLAHLRAEQAESASAAFRRAVELDPAEPTANLQLAAVAMDNTDDQAARAYIEAGLDKHPEDARLLYRLAELEMRAGDVEAARQLLERAVAGRPALLAPRLTLARMALAEGDAEAALALMQQVERENPEVLGVLGAAYLQLQRYEEARPILEARAAAAPKDPGSHYLLAAVHAELGNRAELEAALNRVRELAPDSRQATLALARLRGLEHRFDEADALLGSVEAGAKEDPELLATRLFLARQRGDRGQQLALAERLYAVQPNTAHLLRFTRELARHGEQQRALDELQRWTGQQPDDLTASLALSQLLVQSGRRDDAVAIMRSALAAHPDNVLLLNNLAWNLRLEDPAQALAYAEQAYAQAATVPAVLDTFAETLVRNRQVERGLSMVDRAIQLSNGSWSLRLRRVELLMLAGQDGPARDELQGLLANIPEDVPERLVEKARGLTVGTND